jgi:hypothetical protein
MRSINTDTPTNFVVYYLRRKFFRIIRECDAGDKLSIKETGTSLTPKWQLL